MAGRPRTVQIDERILDALRRVAGEDGRPEDEVIEKALRRYFGLRGLAVLDEITETQAAKGVTVDEDEAMKLAVAEIRAVRAERARRASAYVLRVVIDPTSSYRQQSALRASPAE